MPARLAPYTGGMLPPLFSMNLPEGFLLVQFRARLENVARVEPLLLLGITGDAHPIGRLAMSSDALETLRPGRAALANGECLEELLEWDGAEGLFHELVDRYALRSGISGVQPKVVVPELGHAAAPELIVKAGRDEYPHLPVNEFICMSIVKAAGLPVPDFWLSDNMELFVMRRFDVAADGARLGFEDFAALTRRQPELKYESSYEEIARVIRRVVAGPYIATALEQLFDTVAVSCMVGNGDAHLKNFGVLYTHPAAGDVRMSPVYDLVCSTMYLPADALALRLGGSKAFAGSLRLLDFARLCNVADPEERLRRIEQAVVGTIEKQAYLIGEAPGLRRALNLGCSAWRCRAHGLRGVDDVALSRLRMGGRAGQRAGLARAGTGGSGIAGVLCRARYAARKRNVKSVVYPLLNRGRAAMEIWRTNVAHRRVAPPMQRGVICNLV